MKTAVLQQPVPSVIFENVGVNISAEIMDNEGVVRMEVKGQVMLMQSEDAEVIAKEILRCARMAKRISANKQKV